MINTSIMIDLNFAFLLCSLFSPFFAFIIFFRKLNKFRPQISKYNFYNIYTNLANTNKNLSFKGSSILKILMQLKFFFFLCINPKALATAQLLNENFSIVKD